MDALAPTAALLASFAVCWALLATRRAHEKLSIDDTIPGLQKVHKTPVPRIGGFGILAGVAAGTLVLVPMTWNGWPSSSSPPSPPSPAASSRI